MNPIEKAIAALYNTHNNLINLCPDKYPEHARQETEEALQALRSMQEVDVEGLIKPDGDTIGGLVKSRGWNEAVRYISHKYHIIPKE